MMKPSEVLALAESIPGCLTETERAALLTLALEVRDVPGEIVEVGALFGKSAALLTAGGHVTTIDFGGPVEPWMIDVCTPRPACRVGDLVHDYLHYCLKPVADQVEVLNGVSCAVLTGLQSGSAKLVFLDGGHTSPTVDNDIREAMRIVRPGGIVALHDWRTIPGYNPWPDVPNAWARVFETVGEPRGFSRWEPAMAIGRIGAWYRAE